MLKVALYLPAPPHGPPPPTPPRIRIRSPSPNITRLLESQLEQLQQHETLEAEGHIRGFFPTTKRAGCCLLDRLCPESRTQFGAIVTSLNPAAAAVELDFPADAHSHALTVYLLLH